MFGKQFVGVLRCSILMVLSFLSPTTPAETSIQENPAQKLAAAIANATTEEERVKLLNEAPGALTPELIDALLKQISAFDQKGKFTNQQSLAEFTQKKSTQINYAFGRFNAGRHLCNSQYAQGQTLQALDCFERNLRLAEEIGQPRMIAIAMLDVTVPLIRLRKEEIVMDYQKRALKVAEEINDIQIIAVALNNLGRSMSGRADYQKAIEYYEQALQLIERKKSLDKNDKITEVILWGNLGLNNQRIGNYERAMYYFHGELRLAKALNNPNLLNKALTDLASGYLTAYQFEAGVALAERAVEQFEKLNDLEGLSAALGTLSLLKLRLGNPAEAESLLQKRLKLAEDSKIVSDISYSLAGLAELYLEQKAYHQAQKLCQRKLALDISSGNKREVSKAYLILGKVLVAKEEYAAALQQLNPAFDIARTQNRPSDLYELLILSGQAYLSLGQRSQAAAQFTEAQQIAERLNKQSFGGAELRQALSEQWIQPNHALMTIALDSNRSQSAFEQAQLSKARTLVETLNSGHVNIKKFMTSAESGRESQLRGRVATLNIQRTREMARTEETPELKKINSEWEAATQEYDRFLDSLYSAHPEIKTSRGELKPLSAIEAGSLLTDNKSALLDFVVTEKETLLFVITKEQGKETLNTHRIAIKQSDLAERVNKFREAVGNRNLAIQQPAIELYNLLIKPAEKELAGKTSLTIFPDGPMWEIPFQALQPKQKTYLIENYDLSYAPSLPALQAMNKQRLRQKPAGMKEILAIGNPAFSATQTPQTNVFMSGNTLVPLPESERLVKELRQIYGADRSKVLVGAEATEQAFKENVGQYRVLQLATHGLLNNISPMYSSLVMAAPIANGKEDGLLEARELIDLELNADLAILSACETGRGKVSAGEGVIGLSWALQIAGCPTSVVSQWKVESASTTELMLEFHRQLNRSQKLNPGTPSKALRAAMLKLLRSEQYKHPAYWAGFAVVGAN